MDWLLHNPIADMPGPSFLLLELAVIVVLIVGAARARRRSDPTNDLETPPVPARPDPRAIAYLRGGAQDLTRLVVFDLFRRGHLRLQEPRKGFLGAALPQKIERGPVVPDDLKDPIVHEVVTYFNTPRGAADLFQPNGLAARVEELSAPLAEALRKNELLSAPERYAAAWRVWFSDAFLILALAGYKLWVALEKGRHNVVFLILLGVAGLIGLGIACYVPRLSRRGKAYLRQLQEAFADLKTRTADESERALMTGSDPAVLLAPALFGVAALAGTEYAHLADLFRRSAGTGGGCGGGGCGGGGCGGCGGGCGGCGG